MPVRDPRVDEKMWGIDFCDFAVTLKLAHTIDGERSVFHGVAVTAAGARIHLPLFDRTADVAKPERKLCGIGERPENTLGRSGDLDFADDGVSGRGEEVAFH